MRKTKLKYLVEALDALQVGGVLSKVSFIKAHWYDYDFFTARSFDVFYTKAKKILVALDEDGNPFEEKCYMG